VLVDPATSVTAYGTPILDIYGTAAEWSGAGNNQGSGGDLTLTGTLTDA
jgi:hypothetical protein